MANPHKYPHKYSRPGRRSRWGVLGELSDEELAYVVREYVPASVSMIGQARESIQPLPRGFPAPESDRLLGICIRIEDRYAYTYDQSGREVLADPIPRGAPTAPRYAALDDLYPVMYFVAHALARRIERSEDRVEHCARRLGLREDTIQEARNDPAAWAVRAIIRDLRGEEFALSERAFKTYRRRWWLLHRWKKTGEAQVLNSSVRFFLVMQPPPFAAPARIKSYQESHELGSSRHITPIASQD